MAKREFLMLAHVYKPAKHGISGWLMSEKLDGMRCFWDGGVTRGMPKKLVPWANNNKDERYVEPPIATGLWSRYGNVIHAPDWWLDHLPAIPLDGELFTQRQDRPNLMSIIKDIVPGEEWETVRYFVFDSPPPEVIFSNGYIKGVNFDKVMDGSLEWYMKRAKLTWHSRPASVFQSVITRLRMEIPDGDPVVQVHGQLGLPFGDKAIEAMRICHDVFVDRGGEGIIARDPFSNWLPERSHKMIKVKKYLDAEAIVTGYTTGRLTDKGSKLLGLMGALVTDFNGNRFELSGFTEAERILEYTQDCNSGPGPVVYPREWAMANPGEDVPSWIQAAAFPRGTVVTFKYRELSPDLIPQEASYYRKRG